MAPAIPPAAAPMAAPPPVRLVVSDIPEQPPITRPKLMTRIMTIDSFFMVFSYLLLSLETKAFQNGPDPQFQITNNH
jgi:hypothetical protein